MLRVGHHFFAMSVPLMRISAAVVFLVVVLYDAAVLLAAVAVAKRQKHRVSDAFVLRFRLSRIGKRQAM